MTEEHPNVTLRFLEEHGLTNGRDLEWALRAAERMLERAEERKRHEQNRSFAILSVIAGTVISLFASVVAVVEVITFSNTALRNAAAVFPVVAATLILGFSVRALRRSQHEATLDTTMRLAMQIASMVGDALLDVADQEGWSFFRIETTKLRLSAFPLAERPRRFGEW